MMVENATETDRFVTLRNGLVLPIQAVRLALDLENRGIRLEADDDGLAVSPKHLIRDEDRVEIRKYRNHLMVIATYVEERVQ